MIHSIHHRHTGAVIFTAEIEADENTSDAVKLGLAVKAAVREGANLTGADLSWANLTEANLSWANLTGANLKLADMEVVYTDTEKKNPTIGTLSEIGAKPGDMVEYVHGEKGQFILPDWPGKVLWDMSVYGIPHRLNKSNWRIVSRSGDAVRADATPILSTTGQLKYFGRDILSIFEQALRYADNPSPEHRSEFEAPASSGIGFQNGRILGSMIRSAKLVGSKDFGLARDEIFAAMIMMAKTAIEIDMQNPSGEEH